MSAHLRATAPATGSGCSCISIRVTPSTRASGESAAAGTSHSDPPLSTQPLAALPTPGGVPTASAPPSAPVQPEEMSADPPSGETKSTLRPCAARVGADADAARSSAAPDGAPDDESSAPGAGCPNEAVMNGGDAEKSPRMLVADADTDESDDCRDSARTASGATGETRCAAKKRKRTTPPQGLAMVDGSRGCETVARALGSLGQGGGASGRAGR